MIGETSQPSVGMQSVLTSSSFCLIISPSLMFSMQKTTICMYTAVCNDTPVFMYTVVCTYTPVCKYTTVCMYTAVCNYRLVCMYNVVYTYTTRL